MLRSLFLSALFLTGAPLLAQESSGSAAPVTLPTGPEGFDAGFLMTCCALIFLMQAGFCLLELGMSRAKNSINIVMKNILDFSAGTVGFFIIGFALMFGVSQNGLIGFQNLGFSSEFYGNHPIWIFWLFQVMFATAAVTISSGSMAERTFFPGYLAYAFVATSVIYPILGHWAWAGGATDFGFGGGQGWLAELGFRDFAGSSVVHSTGGAFALAGIIVVGARRGRFTHDGEVRILSGHNAPMAALGVFLLSAGWFGFNGGSNILADVGIGRIMTVTLLSAATGLLGALSTHWLRNGWADMEVSLNGLLGGLVAATACCANVSPWTGLVIGLIAGIITALGGDLLLKLRLDDAVGAIPVHLFCGIWGTLAVSVFDESGAFSSFGIQAIGAIIIPITAFVLSWILFWVINRTIGLRASDDAQQQGLDFAEHSATAYPDFVVNESDLAE